MKLEKFKKNNKYKKTLLTLGIASMCLGGGIILSKSYALYETKKEYNVIKGEVPQFNAGDIRLAYTINGKNVSGIGFPNKDYGYTSTKVQCENGVSASWDDTSWSLTNINNPTNQERIKCSVDFTTPTMSDYLINLIEKDNSIISIEHEETDQTGISAKTDYRFVGANPNNYVCLEADGICTEDELYRIIGVIPTQKDEDGDYENRVKLVKNTSIGQYPWSGNTSIMNIDWTQSTFNTVTLNEEYWEQIKDYQKYIEEAKWYLGITGDTTTSLTYKQERQNNTDSPNNFIANIGLMYVSDFAYSLDPQYNSLCIYPNYSWYDNVDCQNNAWIGTNKTQWLINTYSKNNVLAYASLKNVWGAHKNNKLEIKPSFYLKSQVKYLGGTGETSNPYRIMID